MDWGEMGNTLLVFAAIFVLLALNIFLRTRRKERTPLEICFRLLADVNLNQKLVEDFQFNLQV